MDVFMRISLWFGCLLLSVCLFSAAFGGAAFSVVFRVTMIFALPVALLFLPWLVFLSGSEARHTRILLVSGILIGPASLVIWGLIEQLRGGDTHTVWIGNGLDQGIVSGLVYALIVGSLTTAFYLTALKTLRCGRPTPEPD